MIEDKKVAIGLGCVTFGREIDQQCAFSMMDYALSCDIKLFDTASAYHHGASESIIGSWLASRQPAQSQVLVATKVSPPYSSESIIGSIDESLKRLGRDTLDIFYLHSWDDSAKNLEVLRTLDRCVKQGKAIALGASNFTADQLEEVIQLQQLNGLMSFKYIQNNHNFAVSDITTKLINICSINQIEIVTYSPLGAGFLTGKYTNGVPEDSRFSVVTGHQDIYFTDQALKKCEWLRKVSHLTGYSMGFLAMSWALHQSEVKYVLVGGRSPEQLEMAVIAQEFYDKDIFKALNIYF
ncbi:aldo/keto reductase [Pedobacter heparinus]|uniref:aldo/keto reductase n=1 Tax=Pedobacter heparinus TaxID=984 RepID=UPI00292FE4D7|nr:aldo/keto reductase [Pedobacter heparinus]